MCHPAIPIAFSALTSAAQYVGEKQVAEATYDYKLKAQEATVVSAADAARHQHQGVASRTIQVRAAAAQEAQNLERSYMTASAQSRASAAAGGVSGTSVEEASYEFAQRRADFLATRMQNLSWEEEQLLATSRGIEAQHRERVEGAKFAPVAMPSALGMIAGIGSGIMDAYSMFPEHSMWKPFKTT